MLHLIAGLLLLALTLWVGAQLCRRFFSEDDGLALIGASLPVGLALFLCWGALAIPWLGLWGALGSFAVLLVVAAVVLRRQELSPVRWPGIHPAEWAFLAVGLTITVVYALFLQSARLVVEDSFFVHAANLGLMLNGHYPPINFLGQELHGHFGRDLLIVLLSAITGAQFLLVDWLTVTVVQAWNFLLCFSWLRRETGSPLQACLGTGFLFFGANCASSIGLMDTLTNNNAVAFMFWLLAGYAFFRVLEAGRGWWLAGILLGIDALVYEVHFGLIGLAVVGVTVYFGLLRRQTLKEDTASVRGVCGFLVVAGLLAAVVGGPISKIAARLLHLQKPSAEVRMETEMESQQIRLQVPKDQLFQVRRNNLRPSLPFETRFRPWKADFAPSNDYAPVWSRAILDSFWYPTWLAPLTLIWLFRKRSFLGAWFASFGVLGFLIPSLVGFGYFEQETGRWLLMAAFGWSTAFGLMVGSVFESAQGKLKILATLFAFWAVWFGTAGVRLELEDMAHAWGHPGQAMRDGSPGRVPGAGLIPDPLISLQHHYRLYPEDWEAAEWLHENARPGERFLFSYQDDPPMRGGPRPRILTGGLLNRRGVVVGLTGLLPEGITGGPETDRAAPMFSQSLHSLTFWATGDPARLLPYEVQWVWTRQDLVEAEVLRRLESHPALSLEYRRKGHSIFRFDPSKVDFPSADCPGVELEAIGPPIPLRPRVRQVFEQSVRSSLAPEEGCLVRLRFRCQEDDVVATGRDLVWQPVRAGEQTFVLAAPHVAGSYAVEFSTSDSEAWSVLQTVEVDNEELRL